MSTPRLQDDAALVRHDAIMRFAVGVTFGFVLCEAMGWGPTALPPVLAGVLLANLPGRPNLKLAIVIIGAMTVSSLLVWMVSVLLADVPTALFIGVAILLFATYLAMLRGAPALPCILMLVSLATIPVITMAAPQQAGLLPQKLINSILLALLITWTVYLPWPRPPPQAPKAPKAPGPDPVIAALVATVIVMPVMLLYLMYSPVQAMPVMIATVMLVTNFDQHRSTRDAIARVVHNALGAALGVFAYWTLLVAPSLITLSLISFLIALWFGAQIAEGGPRTYNAVLATTACFVIFSSAIASGPTAAGLWLPRVFYFATAGLFVVGAMQLLWGRFVIRPQPQPV
jgi:hypothetical protein